jgi:hypothetical protein
LDIPYYKTSTEIAKELDVTPVLDKIQEYMRNWIQLINRMPPNRLPRIAKKLDQTARGTRGDYCRDFCETGTGQQVAHPHASYMIMTTYCNNFDWKFSAAYCPNFSGPPGGFGLPRDYFVCDMKVLKVLYLRLFLFFVI